MKTRFSENELIEAASVVRAGLKIVNISNRTRVLLLELCDKIAPGHDDYSDIISFFDRVIEVIEAENSDYYITGIIGADESGVGYTCEYKRGCPETEYDHIEFEKLFDEISRL